MTLYERLAEEVRLAIQGGVYCSGEKLPSIRDVSRGKRISVNTVVRAYGVLEQEGWVSAAAKSGYFVSQQIVRNEVQSDCAKPWSGTFDDLMPELLQHTQQPNILNLGLAQPESDLMPHALIAKTMRSVLRDRGPDILGYCDPAGIRELRKQIVILMSRAGLSIDMDNVVVTNGCQEALFVAFRMLTRAGDVVAVESPCYCGALQILSNLGLKILEIPSTPEQGIRQDLLLKAARSYKITACYVMTGVSNPLAGSMTQSAKKSLCELAEAEGFRIVEDYTNGDLAEPDVGRRPLKAYDRSNRVVLCSSFSKTLSPGLRVGWLAAEQRDGEALTHKYGMSLNVSALNQLTVSRILSGGHYRRHLVRVRAIHAKTLALLKNTIEQHFPSVTEISTPQGGFYIWVGVPIDCDTVELGQRCFKRGVAFAPGRIFSVSQNYRNYLRIGWGGSWSSRVADGVRLIAACVDRHTKK